MTYNDKMGRLLQRVMEKAEAGELIWTAVKDVPEDEGETYGSVIDNRNIEVRRLAKPDGSTDYALDLFDAKGEYIRSIWDNEIRQINISLTGYQALRRIFIAARDNATGAMSAIDQYLEILE